jgi:hypothetical protein
MILMRLGRTGGVTGIEQIEAGMFIDEDSANIACTLNIYSAGLSPSFLFSNFVLLFPSGRL